MNKHIAVLDLGTNVFHLLIAEVRGNTINEVLKVERAVKLGEKSINEGYITPAAFNRGLETIKEYKSLIEQSGLPCLIKGAGTSALRSARNGKEFISAVLERTGIHIDIIDGDREATLIYTGVKHALNLDIPSLIMDIGGGSIEFIIGDDREVFYKRSFPLGAARLMQLYHHSDPISLAEISAIEEHVKANIIELDEKIKLYNPGRLIGSAGAFETFAALLIKENDLAAMGNSTSFNYDLVSLRALLDRIIRSTHAERLDNPLIIPVRVDMSVTAAIITRYMLTKYNFSSVMLSNYSLKEGLLFEIASNTSI